MGRAPCCDKANVKRGPWSPEEDAKLKEYIEKYGTGGNWIALPQRAGLRRCGKSCRLRWLNYLRPDIKHGDFTEEEDRIICNLYASIGSRWSIIAARLPGRTDNDIKNYWNTKLKKKIMGTGMGRGTITAQRNSYPHHTSFSSFLQTASPSSSCFTSYLSYNCSSNTYESMQTSSSITGLQQVPISTSCLLSNMSSLSTASSFLHPRENFQSLMQHPRAKESVVVGSEASCSSSDGSTVNNLNQIIHGKELEYELKDSTQDDKILSYVCNDGVEETQKFMAPDCGNLNGKVNKSTASWRENYAFDLGLEEIKQLISTSSCNSSILFGDNTLE